MPSKIEWCDETLNPQGWGCYGPGGTPDKPQRCWYCYIERQAKGPYVPDCELCRKLIPHWHPERLEIPLKWRKPRKIFWQSMGDLFHLYTSVCQIEAVLDVARATPQHTHIFCTKNPVRYQDFNPWPGNCILLTTITGHPGLWEEEQDRAIQLLRTDCRVRGLSIEPLLGPVEASAYLHPYCVIVDDWALGAILHLLIIGAYTGKGASRFVPARVWVQSLIDQGRDAGVPIFLKNNLRWPEKIQEWPQ